MTVRYNLTLSVCSIRSIDRPIDWLIDWLIDLPNHSLVHSFNTQRNASNIIINYEYQYQWSQSHDTINRTRNHNCTVLLLLLLVFLLLPVQASLFQYVPVKCSTLITVHWIHTEGRQAAYRVASAQPSGRRKPTPKVVSFVFLSDAFAIQFGSRCDE